jgi:predicted alpha/beta hydrolase family esterase
MRLSAAELRSQGNQVWYPQFPSPETPDPAEWLELLRQESDMMDAVEGEKICVAHSLGTTNWIIGALNDIYQKPFDRVLLVAPPDPQMTASADGISGKPLDLENPRLVKQTRKWARNLQIIASEDDKWLPRGIEIYKPALEVEPIVFQGAGHFSLDDGFGPWSGLLKWIETKNAASLLER